MLLDEKEVENEKYLVISWSALTREKVAVTNLPVTRRF